MTLRLSDGREGPFDKPLLDAAQTRLAYVSRPFPAQGQTTDTDPRDGDSPRDRRRLLRDTRPASIGELRAERDRLQDLVRTYATSVAQEVSLLERDAADLAGQATDADKAAGRLRTELDGMGPPTRRGTRATELRTPLTLSEAGPTTRAEPSSPRGRGSPRPRPARRVRRAGRSSTRTRARISRDVERALTQPVSTEAAWAVEQPGEHLIRVLSRPPDTQREADRETWTRAAHAGRGLPRHSRDRPGRAVGTRTATRAEPDPVGAPRRLAPGWRERPRSAVAAGIDGHGRGSVEQRLARADGLIPDAAG